MEDESTEPSSPSSIELDTSDDSDVPEEWENAGDENSGVLNQELGEPSTSSSGEPPEDIQQHEHPSPRLPTYLNRATLEETSRLVNASTRIARPESPSGVIIPENGEVKPLHPAPPNTQNAPLAGLRRWRSLSVEIIDARARPATRPRLTDRARRERRAEFLAQRLEADGFVFTGFRVV